MLKTEKSKLFCASWEGIQTDYEYLAYILNICEIYTFPCLTLKVKTNKKQETEIVLTLDFHGKLFQDCH